MSKRLVGNRQRGLLFIISAPAGTGKTTLVEMLVEEFPDAIAESRSCTTRAPRPGEIKDRHYQFISREEFICHIEAGEFIEYAEVFGHFYGTLKEEVIQIQNMGKHVILVIDTQGAMLMRDKVDACFIFISPPSLEELKRRLFKRRTEDDEKIKLRLSWAEKEMKMAPNYDYQIINDDLTITYQILKSIIIGEEHATRHLLGRSSLRL